LCANGEGKSNLLEAIELLAAALRRTGSGQVLIRHVTRPPYPASCGDDQAD